MELKVKIDAKNLLRRIALVTSRETVLRLNRRIGEVVFAHTKGHISEMSPSRHRVADRLGAEHSGHLEGARDRMTLDVNEKGATIRIKNTPGLSRAFHDLHITPKRAGALTIPLHRVAYGKRVADLRDTGHVLFRPKGKNILAEKSGTGRLRPLYALVRSATVPKDPGLLPARAKFREWTEEAAEQFFDLSQ